MLLTDGSVRRGEHTGKLVELQRESYRKEKQLISNRDEECNGEVVVVKGMDSSAMVVGYPPSTSTCGA
jgi:hypothetical protein